MGFHSPLIRPYFLGGGVALGGLGPLDSHETKWSDLNCQPTFFGIQTSILQLFNLSFLRLQGVISKMFQNVEI